MTDEAADMKWNERRARRLAAIRSEEPDVERDAIDLGPTMSADDALRVLAEPVREAFTDWGDVVGRAVLATEVFAWTQQGREQWVVDFDLPPARRGRLTVNRERLGRTPGRDARFEALRALVPVWIVFVPRTSGGRPSHEFVLARAPAPPPSPSTKSPQSPSVGTKVVPQSLRSSHAPKS